VSAPIVMLTGHKASQYALRYRATVLETANLSEATDAVKACLAGVTTGWEIKYTTSYFILDDYGEMEHTASVELVYVPAARS